MANIRHLRALQAFDAAATRSNLSKAAEDLGVTHGAISRQIKQLELHLGVTLLERLPNGVIVTDAGARLHLATQQAFAALEQGIGATKRTRSQRSITISLSSSLAIKWLVPKLPDFRQRHPAISIFLDIDDRMIDFRESDVDVALRYGVNDWSGPFSERLASEDLIVVAAPGLTQDCQSPPKAEITQFPLLHDQFHPYWDDWAKVAGLQEARLQARSTTFPDSAVLIAAAIDGQGAILVRRILVADDIEAGRLVRLCDIRVEQERSLHFVCRDGDQLSKPISDLRTWLHRIC